MVASSRSPGLIFSPASISPREPPQGLLGLEQPLLFRPHLVETHFSEDAVLLSDVLSCWPLHLAAPGSSLSYPTDYPFLMLLVFGCWLFLVVKHLSSLSSGTSHQLTSRLQLDTSRHSQGTFTTPFGMVLIVKDKICFIPSATLLASEDALAMTSDI